MRITSVKDEQSMYSVCLLAFCFIPTPRRKCDFQHVVTFANQTWHYCFNGAVEMTFIMNIVRKHTHKYDNAQ